MQPNNIRSVFTHKPFSFQVCVSFQDRAAAWRTQLLFAKWSSKIPRPCWHVMTNVWTLAGKPAVISKTLSEIMAAEGVENTTECKLQQRQWAGKKNSLVDDNTVCFCDRSPHFSIHLSTYSIKHIVSSKGKWAAEWQYTITILDRDLRRYVL